MKLIRFSAAILITMIFSLSVNAQKITDDDLKKYITVMDSIEVLKNRLTTSMNNLAKGNDKISSNRYNALIQIINNETKLLEAKATPDEIDYVKKAVVKRDEEMLKFQTTYQSLLHDYIGEAAFASIRSNLKTDANLKRKYDSLKVIQPKR
jgi:hypothetical protein